MNLLELENNICPDPAVFLSIDKYKAKTGKQVDNLQQLIEEPHIHLLALGSPSISDQLALIGDRVDCLLKLPTILQSSTGVATNPAVLSLLKTSKHRRSVMN